MRPAMTAFRYQPFYCEENVWWLCQEPALAAGERLVAFISNSRRSCPVWLQRAAPPGAPVLWDYHVILLVRDDAWRVWDLDSRLPLPCPAVDYLAATFPVGAPLDAGFAPRFRLIDADLYVARLHSDRRHMRDPGGGWLQPPPPWPPPAAAGQAHNLDAYIDVGDGGEGTVVDLAGLRRRLEER